MEKRRLGRTGHMSSIVTLGTFAIGVLDQAAADRLIEAALERGVNHFDVAPTYADAEVRLGDYLRRHPLPELMRTMERLGRDKLDLYQLHAVCNAGDLDACFRSGGSMETLTSAYDDGLVANLGITGHGWDAPATHLAALDLYPFATVMTSANRFMVDNTEFGRAWTDLLERAARDDVGVHLLKATARLAWGDRPHRFATWYEPFTEQADVDRAVSWALQQPITTICSAGDEALFGPIADAASRYRDYGPADHDALLTTAGYGDIFVAA
jgi:aryl-alcohol dehydrogenase-like predicted oxidoreductase